MAEAGHNSGVAADELKEFARRIVRLEDDKKEAVAEFNEDLKTVRAEAKSRGYDTKILTKAIQLSRLDAEDRTMLDLYCGALNVFD
ncbi:DUF2312 domain-containing protein [Aurantimonas sp. MSK8Z-1]|uniref:DUF2312 domain-containing protein n=1 Tax=Mangrovibrevibacter kandeliae TaxID=2968473 RepID=UPI002118A7C4|nr:GapR family DNA-binding domain-containing protein [Aurantimonas sp. MSK8Z-1]MCW4115636.1 DUF2312 domain-containing protein [Aurantimonas sp. MSK8Z-1]